MRQSIGYTQTLNIMIVFITVVFMFIFGIVNYYKAYKVNNVLISGIEKFEGYNKYSESDILVRIDLLGYDTSSTNCYKQHGECSLVSDSELYSNADGDKGYCVYYCNDGNDYYHYRVGTNMFINIPIINKIIPIKVYSNSKIMYDFEKAIK